MSISASYFPVSMDHYRSTKKSFSNHWRPENMYKKDILDKSIKSKQVQFSSWSYFIADKQQNILSTKNNDIFECSMILAAMNDYDFWLCIIIFIAKAQCIKKQALCNFSRTSSFVQQNPFCWKNFIHSMFSMAQWGSYEILA